MINQRTIDLINQEIDGVNTQTESDELRRELDRDPQSSRYDRELRDSLKLFDQIEVLTVPDEVHEAILARFPESEPEIVRPSFRQRAVPLAWAACFAAGLLLGLGIYDISRRLTPQDGSGTTEFLSGTANGHGAKGQAVRLPLSGTGVSGTAVLQTDADLSRVILTIDSIDPVAFTLTLPTGAACTGYRVQGPAPSGIRVGPELIRFEHLGRTEYHFDLTHENVASGGIQISMTMRDGITRHLTLSEEGTVR